jgi:hypothetical protein
MTLGKVAAIAVVTASATLPLAGIAHADVPNWFESPSGNIVCSISGASAGKASAGCEIRNHTWAIPSPPGWYLGGGCDRFVLDQGSAPVTHCHTDTSFVPGPPVLDYGQTDSIGAITCNSEPTGITCTDTSTGHFFRVSRESYQLR